MSAHHLSGPWVLCCTLHQYSINITCWLSVFNTRLAQSLEWLVAYMCITPSLPECTRRVNPLTCTKAGLIWVSISCLVHGLHGVPHSTIRTRLLASCQLSIIIVQHNTWCGWWYVYIPPPVYLLELDHPFSPCTQGWINMSARQLPVPWGLWCTSHKHNIKITWWLSTVSFQNLTGPIPRVFLLLL